MIRQHDALRTRLVADDGGWRVYVDEPHTHLPFSVHHIDAGDASAAEQLVEREATRLRSSISLSEGPLVRMALFDLGETRPQRLFLMVNHLASDGLSWARLWEDLEDAYDHVARGDDWHPPKTESFRTWAHRLDALAQSPATVAKADDWLALPWESVRPLPQDFDVDAAQNTNGSVGVLQVQLEADVSRSLDRFRIDYRGDLLVGAIAEAVSEWSGEDTVLLDVLGHGREEICSTMLTSRAPWVSLPGTPPTCCTKVALSRAKSGPKRACRRSAPSDERAHSHTTFSAT